MHFKNLSIVGGGPNAVYALEILLKKILSENLHKKYTVRVFEQHGLFGCGKTHSKYLRESVLLNRVAGQISLGSYPFNKFPKKLKKYDYNFMEWKSFQTNTKLKQIKPTDWPARKIFGLALEEKFYDLLKIFRENTNVNIELHFKKVININNKKNNFVIETNDNQKYRSDKILIATGNYISSKKSSALTKKLSKFVKNTKCHYEFNFLKKLDDQEYWGNIRNKKIVVYGTGVSSLDVILMLEKQNNIFFPISRTFLFPFARPINRKLNNPSKLEHKAIILKEPLIQNIKKIINNSRYFKIMDFNKLVFPYIKVEFYLIYFQNFLKNKDYKLFKDFCFTCFDKSKKIPLDNSINEKKIDDYLIYLIKNKIIKNNFYNDNWFSQKKILSCILSKKNSFFDFFSNPLLIYNDNFVTKYLDFLQWDIKEAKKGNIKSSYKKACDGLWRDLRPQLTILFDNCKNIKMLNYFLKNILSIHNRLCDGPSLEIIEKIRKYIKLKKIRLDHKINYKFEKKNKIVFLKSKKQAIKIGYIFSAIANIYKDNFYSDELVNNMLRNDIVDFNREAKNDNKFVGLKLSKDQHPINYKSHINRHIRFVGPASEGSKFFHHTLSRPDKKQFNILDLENWVNSL